MKQKYYLRGIGVGILFATIILFTAYSISGQGKMTDEEVIARAEELGMIKSGSVLDNLTRPSSTEEDSDTSEADPSTAENGTSEHPASDTQEPNATTEGGNGNTQEPDTSTETVDPDVRMVTFTVVSGMNSWNVATILQDQGVIADAADFDSYLEANGYSSRISTGEYTIAVGSDYESIAKLLTGN